MKLMVGKTAYVTVTMSPFAMRTNRDVPSEIVVPLRVSVTPETVPPEITNVPAPPAVYE